MGLAQRMMISTPLPCGGPPSTAGAPGAARMFGVHLGLLALQEPHPHADRRALESGRRDLEPALARDREALPGAPSVDVRVAVERRVVGVAEERLQPREDLLQPLVHLAVGDRRARARSRRLLAGRRRLRGPRGLQDADPEADDRLGLRPEPRAQPSGTRPEPERIRHASTRASARARLSRLRALCSLDITVPIGQLSTSAISRYERPSTSLSMIIVRALGGKASSACRMRSRCSAPGAAWSGPPPGSGVVRAHSSSVTRSGAEGARLGARARGAGRWPR